MEQAIELPRLSKSWDVPKFPFFKKLITDLIEVTAWQVPMPEGSDPSGKMAFAKVMIRKNGRIVHSQSIDFPMFVSDAGLLLQVYCISVKPDYEAPEWQPTLEKFCRSFESFEEPTRIWWGKSGESIFD